MLRKLLSCFTLPLLLLLSNSSGNSAPQAEQSAPEGFNPGPDIITGDIGLFGGLEQFGSNGTQVGLAPSTTSCNAGDQVVQFFALPQTEHPLIPHNLYRMSGGAGNDERFEQIGQGWPKHAFGADQASDCFDCQPGGNFNHLGVGCSDTYANFQNAEQTDLGSRALINPFTGVFQSTANNHNGHVHDGTSHRILVEGSDLNTTLNPGASYYAEVQYISSDEYAWCQDHPGQCNMYNNVSYRRYNVSGLQNFTFAEVGNTVRMAAAVTAWPGATINPIEPAPGTDGRAFIAYKVTNPSAGVWHYEYALYNENLDRAIQSFSIPLGCAITLSNLGFHAPPNHPGFPNDGSLGGLGFSNAPWTSNQTSDALSWSSETFILNQNANAIRWGTLYNFRFDSNKPPIPTNATIGFFKTGTPVTVGILGPNACDVAPSATPSATATPPNPSPTATATPPSPTPTPTPTPTPPPPAAQALNLSSRMFVQTGDNVGIGGFIISGSAPKHVVVQGVGGLSVPGAMADPVLELHGPPGFVTIINDNCPGGQFPPPPPFCQPGSLNAAIDVTLAPGAYTAIVKGKNDTSGVALVEVYDFNSAVDSKLANISTRAFVGTADNILIAGFILGPNSGDTRIVARGIGPSLAGFGVPNALADPTLELRDNNGTLIRSNNDWQDNAAPPGPDPALIATGLAPTNPLESAFLVTLPPGLYTALLAGVNSGTGVGVVEVYELGSQSGPPPSTPTPTPTPTPPVSTPTPTPPASPSPTSSPGITPTPTPTPTVTPSPTTPPPCLLFNITINGAQEVPPNGSAATGSGFIRIDTVANELIYNITFSGLGSAETMAHIHGFAPPGMNAGIIHTLPLGSPKNGVFNYSDAQEADILNGLSYVNIHSVNFPNGEIRGQIAGSFPCPTPTSPPITTPTPSPATACTENFDGTPRVFLPGGAWVISTVNPFSPPNCLFAPVPDGVSDESIDSVNISIHSTAAVLSFRNNFNTQPSPGVLSDGYVLEVSTNGGSSFLDVTDPSIGGTFVSGPYTGEIDGTGNNPLAGRMAWSGDSGGYILTTINLPASLNGQTIKLRFRMGTDQAVAAPGVRIDDFSLTGGSCP